MLEVLEVELVPENLGQVPSEQPLTDRVDAAVRPTPAIVMEGWPCGER